jgi:hypothetical protein
MVGRYLACPRGRAAIPRCGKCRSTIWVLVRLLGRRYQRPVGTPFGVDEFVGRDGVPANGAEVGLGRERISAVIAGDNWRRLGCRPAAVGTKVRSAHERGPTLAGRRRSYGPWNSFACSQERIELMDPPLECEHLGGAADQQVGLESVAAHHLDCQPAYVPHLDLAAAYQGPTLAKRCRRRERRRGAGRRHHLVPVDRDFGRSRRPAREEREATGRHLRPESIPAPAPYSAMTTRRSSVISRTV